MTLSPRPEKTRFFYSSARCAGRTDGRMLCRGGERKESDGGAPARPTPESWARATTSRAECPRFGPITATPPARAGITEPTAEPATQAKGHTATGPCAWVPFCSCKTGDSLPPPLGHWVVSPSGRRDVVRRFIRQAGRGVWRRRGDGAWRDGRPLPASSFFRAGLSPSPGDERGSASPLAPLMIMVFLVFREKKKKR